MTYKRFEDPLHNDWSKRVRERDRNRCIVCNTGKGILNAHHLNGYADFPEERYILDNGVTLCRRCHQDWFHKIYGRGFNTKAQFDEFISFYRLIKNILLKKRKKVSDAGNS